jgi:hypothetical protein
MHRRGQLGKTFINAPHHKRQQVPPHNRLQLPNVLTIRTASGNLTERRVAKTLVAWSRMRRLLSVNIHDSVMAASSARLSSITSWPVRQRRCDERLHVAFFVALLSQ